MWEFLKLSSIPVFPAFSEMSGFCWLVGSKLYVLGGLCSLTKDVLDDMECFDVTTSERLEDIEPLPNPALGLTCVAIKPEDFSL